MKKHITTFLFTVFFIVSGMFLSCSPKVVAVRPSGTVVSVNGHGPTPQYVWIGESWVWRNGHYVHVNGYWMKPPHGHYHWIDGHWKNKRHGWVWVPGHWR